MIEMFLRQSSLKKNVSTGVKMKLGTELLLVLFGIP